MSFFEDTQNRHKFMFNQCKEIIKRVFNKDIVSMDIDDTETYIDVVLENGTKDRLLFEYVRDEEDRDIMLQFDFLDGYYRGVM